MSDLEARQRRTMTDPQRMIWRDDVEGICQSIDICFEYGEHGRCGPCAIKQAAAFGVESDHTLPNLPEVYRLQREIKALETQLTEAMAALEPLAACEVFQDDDQLKGSDIARFAFSMTEIRAARAILQQKEPTQ